MIFNKRPESWQDLQNMVGQLFNEVGFHVEVSKTVELVRGKKEIDVFVQDTINEYKPIFLIECKYWAKPVSQETVHSFHTVINDFGANFGFIVSKNGFQSGAYEAAKSTNIRLVSLEELEDEYHSKWQSGMIKRFLPIADKLFPYWDPSGGKMPTDGKGISWDQQRLITDAYRPITSIGEWDLHGKMRRKYPMSIPVINDKFEVISEVVIQNDRDYFDFVTANQEKAFRHFKLLYRE